MALSPASLFEPDAPRRAISLFLVGKADPPHQRLGKRLLQALVLVAGAGAVAGLTALLRGHHVMGTTAEVSWGVLIASYVFFVATSTGLTLVGSLGHVFGVKLYEPLAKKATFLALVTLLMGFVCIGTELERPFLLVVMAVVSPSFTSPIWWMGALYGLVTVIIALDLWFMLKGDHAKARVLGVVGIVAEIAANSNLGSVFGMNHARPFWYGPFVPVYFVATALVSGAALLLVATYLSDYFSKENKLREEHRPLLEGLGRLLALFLGILAFFTIWRLVAGVQGSHYHRLETTMAFLTGPLFTSFWFFEVFLMFLVPAAILLGPWRREPAYLAVAGALPLLGMFVARLNFVYAGQMLSLKPVTGRLGEALTYQPPFEGNVAGFLPYTPSIVEVLIIGGALAGAVLLYVAGTRALRLGEEA